MTTRQRIQELAREYHYHPNQLMHGMLTGKSSVIGIVLPQLSVSFNACILSAMLDSVVDAGYRCLIFESYGLPERIAYAINAMIEHRVDGALLYTGRREPLPRELVLGIRSHGIPAISIDAIDDPIEMDTVRTNEMQLAGLAVDYLVSLGHRHIAWLNNGPSLRGIEITRCLEKRLLTKRYCVEPTGAPHVLRSEAARLQALLTSDPRPTALIASDDHIAARVLLACVRQGIRVPEEMSIIGCGNLTVGEFTTPQLTTIDQHPQQIGHAAVQCLLARMQQPDDHTPPALHFIPSQLIPRASCAPPGE